MAAMPAPESAPESSRARLAFPPRLLVAALALTLPLAAHAGDFTHYESAHVHPLALSESGDELYAVNTAEARLAIFAVGPDGALALAGEVPVGLEPVSVAVRPGSGEVWVANHLSDTVSVVDPHARRLLATLHVGDEPTDVAFGSGRAFVSLSGKDDAVAVYDARTRRLLRRIAIPGEDPRALAVSADGKLVVLVVLESGNGSTAGLMRKTRHRGQRKVGWVFTFTAAAYNLVRMRNLAVTSGPHRLRPPPTRSSAAR